MKRISLTFKDNEREMILYNAVEKRINKSAFIKECIEFYLKENNEMVDNNIKNKQHN